jgi:hypothetical protein
MKSKCNLARTIVVGLALLVVALLSVPKASADQPMTKDDITLLLLGSSPSNKIIQMVEQRGVDFQMSPDLAKKFHDEGASDDLIEALQKAGTRAATAKASAPAAPTPSQSGPSAAAEPSPAGKPNTPDAPEPQASEAPVASSQSTSSSSSEPVLHTRKSSDGAAQSASNASSPQPVASRSASSSEPVMHEAANREEPASQPVASAPGLKDPDPQGIQHIISEFAAKEKIFREARNNYTYHQINKVEELGAENQITGTYEQEWDILYDDSGKRIEKVTYAPLNSLKNLIVTKEDLEGFRSIQPFVLTSDELPEYDIKYLGHVKVDQITAYVFSIRPKEIEKNKQYFQGEVWVDDRDLQIVKTNGKQVPQDKVKHGQENLFPRFTTWREQVDGKFWFPTYTMADDTLYFSNAPPVHMKEIVRYTDYKQFKSGSRILQVESVDKKDQTAPPAPAPQK